LARTRLDSLPAEQPFPITHAVDKRNHPKFIVIGVDELDTVASLKSKRGADAQRNGNSSPGGQLWHSRAAQSV